MRFIVGEPFERGRGGREPHNQVQYLQSGLYVFDFWRGACAHSLMEAAARTVELALSEVDEILFVLYRLGLHPWSDAPYSYHLTNAAHRPDLAPVEEGEREPFELVVTSAEDGIVRLVKAGMLTPEFTGALREAAYRDSRRAFEEEERRARLGAIYRRHATSETLLRGALCRMTLGGAAEVDSGDAVELATAALVA
jgi:hypothetical protein